MVCAKRSLHGSDVSRIIVACVMAELLNLLCKWLLCDVAHVPLFMDTIGSVAITFYAGLLPGVFVALGLNVLQVLFIAAVTGSPVYPWEMAYALCGVAIVCVTWAFSRTKANFRMGRVIAVLYLVLIALVSAFASSFIGGMIETVNRLFFDGIAYSADQLEHFVRALLGENLGLLASCVIARIPVTVLDRVFCTFAGFGVYWLVCHSEGKRP